ncbi:LysR substrate-binding domain-containing protein [Streptomyces rapamycinicus]|uniref:LysR family transcriptional regulator n=2 Tax=Streptomyces rapamycinicus TaxID=1226757 RepID=A0A0A0NVU8_STRRN|nr:LysR substrate-binding domain-containing protein [Streptomyces rapamycinicus]AGP59230.1 LysR family transcriptional regulator [Streptomyces rapamycinicus NRRL 5491]MBB4786975.1 DNA-binding transcriptional LysR family regulator [Streptomyces rapamycinicus]RLV77573.1 LysR family transcriptional regulator [Streptomyces rapamycinicus NRRL 5491]UTO66986.1 LysR family transcriptional regulator [Streptomyces rapamycinicus]UTP34943.1 LysR family transcriptional regulator [Streptomyces rapamycinicus
MFTLSQLESFVAVAETLHYGRAAERLSMTQPPLSRRIQLLERELDVELFDRIGRSVRLTAAGRAFLGDARRILGLSEQAALSLRRVPAGEIGTVALGFTASSAHSVLEAIVGGIHTRLPGVDLVLRERVSGTQMEELRSGELDLGLVRPPVPGTGLEHRPLHRETLLAAIPAAHPLAAPDRVPHVRDLDGEPFVMYSPAEARYFYEVLAGVFRSAGITPWYVHHVSQVHTILALVRAGLGLALVPRTAEALRLDGVILRPVTGIENEPVELVAAWHTNNDNPALHAVRNLVTDLAGHWQSGRGDDRTPRL